MMSEKVVSCAVCGSVDVVGTISYPDGSCQGVCVAHLERMVGALHQYVMEGHRSGVWLRGHRVHVDVTHGDDVGDEVDEADEVDELEAAYREGERLGYKLR